MNSYSTSGSKRRFDRALVIHTYMFVVRCLQIPGVKVQVYRIKDPIYGDDTGKFDAAVLAAPIISRENLLEADCIIIGAPGRQGGFAGEVRLFLDSLASFQRPAIQGNTSQLMVCYLLKQQPEGRYVVVQHAGIHFTAQDGDTCTEI